MNMQCIPSRVSITQDEYDRLRMAELTLRDGTHGRRCEEPWSPVRTVERMPGNMIHLAPDAVQISRKEYDRLQEQDRKCHELEQRIAELKLQIADLQQTGLDAAIAQAFRSVDAKGP